MQLLKYEQVDDSFKDGLILGNGASIAVSANFNYEKLYTKACTEGLVEKSAGDVFDFLDSEDFEFVLRHLWYAGEINRRLSIAESKTSHCYELVKNSLINIVLRIHPSPSDVSDAPDKISGFIQQYRKVFSLSYDLLVYWAIFRANDRMPNCVKDCFYASGGGDGVFSEDWHYYEEPRYPATRSTLVFYPHGNLSLLSKRTGEELQQDEVKIVVSAKLLIDEIVERWKSPGNTPLFVSEGTWQQKLNAINSSGYLSDVYYSAIPEIGSGITIFGWSMGDQDTHILNALGRSAVQKVAVAVHAPTVPDIDTLAAQTRKRMQEQLHRTLDIQFFDAESPGCWTH